ncbi:TATA-box-binding protein [Natronomonas amylolytica]|uniref:TATA-box-binding protein n=1 Tax=Natronomonas amylolytica TaxID=3108498 RepID=UPI00300BB73D
MINSELELVNTVAGGQIDAEVDLQALKEDLPFKTCYIKGPGLYFKFDDSGPTIVLARSGKYFFTGAKSLQEVDRTRDATLDLFSERGIIDTAEDDSFSVKNMVFTADIDRSMKLSHLSIILGLESVEYEPEQFPGLIYRPDTYNCVLLIFASGKVVITGATSRETAEMAFNQLLNTISE